MLGSILARRPQRDRTTDWKLETAKVVVVVVMVMLLVMVVVVVVGMEMEVDLCQWRPCPVQCGGAHCLTLGPSTAAPLRFLPSEAVKQISGE